MPTQEQINASRQNGAHSKGPVTPEGRLKASLNAMTHGLTAETVCLSIEDKSAYKLVQQALTDHFQPASEAEVLLLEEASAATWKIRRAASIQTTQYQILLATDTNATPENCPAYIRLAVAEQGLADYKSFENVRRHEDRLTRQRDRLLNQLRKLQKERREAEITLQPTESAQPTSEIPKGQNEPKPPTRIVEMPSFSGPANTEMNAKEIDLDAGEAKTSTSAM
jgi:hypothetical protein